MRVFNSGSPQEGIEVLHDVKDIWRQNVVTRPANQAGVVTAILRGDWLTNFENALEEARRQPDVIGLEEADPVLAPLLPEHINLALDEVAKSVFPYRALENQKLWMSKHMHKPRSMTIRDTAVQIDRLNNSLPLFPNGSNSSKFDKEQLVGLLEYALPETWREKFDMKGYTPSDHDLPRLIMEGEILGRHEPKRNDEDHNKPRHEKKPIANLTTTTNFEASRMLTKSCFFVKSAGRIPLMRRLIVGS